MKGKQQGFTLIELMIAIVIIGILFAVALPQFTTYTQKASNKRLKAMSGNLFHSL